MPGDATKSAPRPSGRLLLCLAAVQFGFGFHGVVYTAFGGYFLRAKFGLAVPEAAQLLALGILLFGLLQFASGLVADLGVRLYGRKAMLVRVAATYTLAWLLFAALPLPLPAVVGVGLAGLAGSGPPIVLSVPLGASLALVRVTVTAWVSLLPLSDTCTTRS